MIPSRYYFSGVSVISVIKAGPSVSSQADIRSAIIDCVGRFFRIIHISYNSNTNNAKENDIENVFIDT